MTLVPIVWVLIAFLIGAFIGCLFGCIMQKEDLEHKIWKSVDVNRSFNLTRNGVKSTIACEVTSKESIK